MPTGNPGKKRGPRDPSIGRKISLAKKGMKQKPQCGFQKGHKVNFGRKQSEEVVEWKRKHYKEKYGKEEVRRQISERQKGEKAYWWRGGITPINESLRHSLEYKLWRESVFRRDNWSCVWCGYKSKGTRPADINADHIKPFAHYPELRFAIDNGRTLCIPCHKTTDSFGGKTFTKKL